MTVPDQYLSRIREWLPDLVIRSARLNQDGAQNDVVIADCTDGSWIFRFTKNEASRAALARELCLLDAIKDHMPVPVPVPLIQESDAMAYRMLEGQPLTFWLLASLDEPTQQHIADQLGAFLRKLHNWSDKLPLPANTNELGSLDAVHDHFKKNLYPHLDPHQREWVDRLFADANTISSGLPAAQRNRLIHNDLKIGHILYDPLKQRLSGILDFGIACYDGPDIDICNLMQCFGESFVTRMLPAYPEAREMLPNARFGVHLMDLEAITDGILEHNPHRMASAVAIPRDVKFPII
jgi:aminoglycoside 2''-phosphotransferase